MGLISYSFDRLSQTFTTSYLVDALFAVDPETGDPGSATSVVANWSDIDSPDDLQWFSGSITEDTVISHTFSVNSGKTYFNLLNTFSEIDGSVDGHHQSQFTFFFDSPVGVTFSDPFSASADGVVVGSDYGDSLTLGGGYNVALAGAGNDLIFGRSGHETQFGESGDDRLAGSDGSDHLDGGSGNNTLDYTKSAIRVKVDIAANTASGGYADGDSILNFHNVSGSNFNDAIYGNSGANVLRGYAGNDTLDGRSGHDISYGYDGNDVLRGGTGNDRLSGMTGNDSIEGNVGSDRLSGEAGADAFFYRTLGDSTIAKAGQDNILDFSQADGDKIKLSDIDAKTAAAGNNQFVFIGNTAFSGTEGELRYVKYATETYVYGDVNGDKKVDFAVHFAGAITFAAGDFSL